MSDNVTVYSLFNPNFYDDLVKDLITFVETWSALIANTAETNIQYESGFSMTYEVAKEVDAIIGTIFPEGAEVWRAWLEEYGKGSEMDLSNPYIVDYITSDMWNPLRLDTTIRGRVKGKYKGANGRDDNESSGRMPGLNLETYAEESGNTEYMPHPGSNFLSFALESNREEFTKQLMELLANRIKKNLFKKQ